MGQWLGSMTSIFARKVWISFLDPRPLLGCFPFPTGSEGEKATVQGKQLVFIVELPQNLHTSLRIPSHWPDFSHMATPSYQGG